MTVKCVLYGRESCKPITNTEVQRPAFYAYSDNPFPASKLTSVLCTDDGITAIYTVKDLDARSRAELRAMMEGE